MKKEKLTITKERADSPEAMQLIIELDDYLIPMYPLESHHGFDVEKLIREEIDFFMMRREDVAVGCGGVKRFGTAYGEIKRMYVRPETRGLGLGKLMLQHLIDYTRQAGVSILRLETGIYQTEAISLYERFGFQRIPPFGEYTEDPNSLFYEKQLD